MRKQIEQLVTEELERANKKFPLFASNHEGYAVIKEEFEEAKEEIEAMHIESLWEAVRTDDQASAEFHVEIMEEYAQNAIYESIQLAAMCKKFIDSQEARK